MNTPDDVVAAIGPRLRQIRTERGSTLGALARATGISVSTLSRMETGLRKPSLELLLPIARAHQISLDELVTTPKIPDPRIRSESIKVEGRKMWPLSRQPGGMQAYKIAIPPGERKTDQQTHDGYEWLFVLSGRLRLLLGEHDLVLGAGEAAEFDTGVPHWFGSANTSPVEILSLFGAQGERVHVRARMRSSPSAKS